MKAILKDINGFFKELEIQEPLDRIDILIRISKQKSVDLLSEERLVDPTPDFIKRTFYLNYLNEDSSIAYYREQ